MLCEDCKKNQATVVITVTAGGEVTTRHLCPECMKKMENSFAQGDVQGFLSSLLSMLSSEPKAPVRICSGCGLAYDEFQRTGKLGCAQCYHDFSDELRPLLFRIHGRSQHAGRVPVDHEKTFQRKRHIDELRERMEKAVIVENFEEAAELRDQIRQMNEKQETEETL